MHVDEYGILDPEVGFSRQLAGKECQCCRRALPYRVYNKDSSSRDGYQNICPRCLSTPRLSAEENYHRYREQNLNSDAIESQRRPDEEAYLDRDPIGRSLYYTEIIRKLRNILGTRLVSAPAYFLNEVSLYIEDPKHEAGYRYIGFLTTDGQMQEFSSYRYNDYLVPVDETRRGYRGLLMKLIMSSEITEKECSKYFGICDEKIWCKTLFNWRNKQVKD